MTTYITKKTFDEARPSVKLRVYLYWASPRACSSKELTRITGIGAVSAYLAADIQRKWVGRPHRGLYAPTAKGLRYYSSLARPYLHSQEKP